jgi:hypothetical protein
MSCGRRVGCYFFVLGTLGVILVDASILLPLGDSITFGCGSGGRPYGSADCGGDYGGYRVPLMWALEQADYGGWNTTGSQRYRQFNQIDSTNHSISRVRFTLATAILQRGFQNIGLAMKDGPARESTNLMFG